MVAVAMNSWCCGSNSNSKQSNHSKGNSNINSFLSRAVAGSSTSGSKNKMIVISMMILAAVVVLVEY